MPADRGAVVRTLLASLTVDELRDVLLALRGPESTVSGKKDQLVEQAITAGSLDKVERTAACVEALTPRKHLWLFGLATAAAQDSRANAQWLVAQREPLRFFRSILDFTEGSSDLELRLHLFDKRTGSNYLKYEHWVTTETWHRVDKRNKRLVEIVVRHNVTVAVRPEQSVLEVRFDGFTQGQIADDGKRLPYSTVASSAAEKAAQYLGVELESVAFGPATERVLDGLPDEVRDIRRSLSTARGGNLALNAGEDGDTDVAAELARFLSEKGGGEVKISREQVRNALRAAPADSVLLLWRKLGLLSRITNHEIAPEILFVWRSSQRSASSISYVVDALLRARRATGAPTLQSLVSIIEAESDGTTFRSTDLAALLGVDRELAIGALERATRDGLVTRVFRVRTNNILEEFVNSWRASLHELPDSVRDEHGHTISLGDPSNVEVGYVRRRTR